MTGCCSLLAFADERGDRLLTIEDYAGATPRWCPGCGDHAVLAAVERLLETEQLPRETTVFVSGIGCSSRFPHYVNTYGFHSLHGRALPVATGIRLRRPDLTVFVVMGDGDCCSIGAGHWVHAIRYNIRMTAIMLDNGVYGLTKNQTSPTSPLGLPSNTQPRGAYLRPLNPLEATLGVTNASFVAQTCDWIPAHLSATLRAAYQHRGFAFVRVLQRCPEYTAGLYREMVRDPSLNELLVHPDGVSVPELESVYRNRTWHDPSDLEAARRLAEDPAAVRLGVFYRNELVPCYDEVRRIPPLSGAERLARLDRELDKYAI